MQGPEPPPQEAMPVWTEGEILCDSTIFVIFLFICPRILDAAVFAIGIHIFKQETQVCSARPIRDISCGAYAGLYILLPTKEEEGRIILNVRKAIPLQPNMLRSSCLFLFQWRASQMT